MLVCPLNDDLVSPSSCRSTWDSRRTRSVQPASRAGEGGDTPSKSGLCRLSFICAMVRMVRSKGFRNFRSWCVLQASTRPAESSGRPSSLDSPQPALLTGCRPQPVVPSLCVLPPLFQRALTDLRPCWFFCSPQSERSASPQQRLAQRPRGIPTTLTTSSCLLRVLRDEGKS